MQMLNERVLILPDPPKKESSGGILIPDKHQDAPESGEIIFSPSPLPELSPGRHVYFFSYSAKDIILEDKKYKILPIKELLISEEKK